MSANLIMTVEQMQDKATWLELRNKGIGGSDIASILGVSKWKSAFQLWLEKTGQSEPEDLKDNEYVYWGAKLEDLVAQRFCEVTGKSVRRRGMLADEEYPFLLANVDRMVEGEMAGLECKTANAFASKEWNDDELPDSYYLQCQWYMMVTGFPIWYIAVLIGGNHFVWKEVSRNEDQIKAMKEAAIGFWNNNVLGGEVPPVDSSENCAKALCSLYPQSNGNAIELPHGSECVAKKIDDFKILIKDITNQKRQLENTLKAELEDNEQGIAGNYKITWKTQLGRSGIDTKLLMAKYPEAYQDCATKTLTRVLRIKEIAMNKGEE